MSSRATIPTQVIAKVLTDYVTFDGMMSDTLEPLSYQPYVFLNCWQPGSCSAKDQFVDFGSAEEANQTILMSSFTDPFNENRTVSQLDPTISIELANTSTVWASHVNHSAVFATTTTYDVSGHVNASKCPSACTVDAHWITTSTIASGYNFENPDPGSLMYGTDNSYRVDLSPQLLGRMYNITQAILFSSNQAFAASIYVTVDQFVAPAIALMMSTCSTIPQDMRWNASDTSDGSEFWSQQPGKGLEKDWEHRDESKYGRAVAYFNPETITDRSTIAANEITAFWDNYRYSSEETTVKLSLAVMFGYVVIVLVYLTFSVFTGYAATSWDSVSELVTLALNTEQPDGLRNTSVGVQTLDTFRKPVRLRVAGDASCQLLFPGQENRSSKTFEKVKLNEAY